MLLMLQHQPACPFGGAAEQHLLPLPLELRVFGVWHHRALSTAFRDSRLPLH